MEGIGVETKRWIVLALASFIGMGVEIITVFSGTVSGVLASHFELDEETIDWMILSNPAISILCSIPLGVLARIYPLEVNKWLKTALFALFLSNAMMAVSTAYKPIYFLMYIAQVICGLVYSMFVILICVTSVSWFAEHEQATVFGVAYGSFSMGNLLAALMPSSFLTYLKGSDISHVAFVTVAIYIAFAAIDVLLLCCTWIYIPDHPALPPSKLEQARRAQFLHRPPIEMKVATTQYFREWKDLMTKRDSLALLFTYSISSALYIMYFVMLPVLPKHSPPASTILLVSTEKAYYLTGFASGGAVASVITGFCFDKLKSYRMLAYLQASVSICTALTQILSYRWSSEIGLYISVSLEGTAVMSLLAFTSEVLKQCVYPRVSEGTQATALATLACAVTVIATGVVRLFVSSFGGFSFYIATGVCCLFASLMILFINPTLNRYETETIQLIER